MDTTTNKDSFGIGATFGDHEPRAGDAERCAAINDAAREFARVIADSAPQNSNETRHAIRAVQEAALWAREAIRTWQPAHMVENGILSQR